MKKVLITLSILAVANLAMASEGDELTSLSYISYLERYATVMPANQEETIEAVINMPLVAGDRVDTAREARMEVLLADGNTLWLDEYTTLSLDAVAFSRDAAAERTVLFVADGAVMVEITEHSLTTKPMRVDSGSATVYLDEPGLYRLQALPSGGLRVEVRAGLAEAATTAGGVLVRAETSAEVGAGQVLRSEGSLTWGDEFAVWVEARRLIAAGESAKHVDLRYSRQASQLDTYGSWIYVDSINTWAWRPSVGIGWTPYTAGRWYWTPTGYAWISYEPWGWLPYHYGSWHFTGSFGWVWSWGGYWGPAWVNWMWWPGYVGWCPYGYYNSWYWNHYGGYYPPYYGSPHRPSYPGAVPAKPPRRDVAPPPRTTTSRLGGAASQPAPGDQPALDLNGRVRLASVDRRGWTVVAQDDFTSPNLTRLAKPADRVLPTEGDQTGIVMTGPLTTRAPSLARQSPEIERVFRGVEVRSAGDLSPLLARDSSLSPDAARRIGGRTTVSELSGRAVAPVSADRSSPLPRLSSSGSSPFASSPGLRTRAAEPNIYRPTMYNDAPAASSSPGISRGAAQRQPAVPRTSSGVVGSTSRPVIVPSTGSSSTLRRAPITSGTSSSGVRTPSASSAPRSSAPSAGSTRSVGSSSVRRSPSKSPSRPSSVGGSRSSGAAPRSSVRPSRPSGGSSKPSGGATRRPSGGSSGAQKR